MTYYLQVMINETYMGYVKMKLTHDEYKISG